MMDGDAVDVVFDLIKIFIVVTIGFILIRAIILATL